MPTHCCKSCRIAQALLLAAVVALTGCAALHQTAATDVPAAGLGGKVFGGQQPITGSTVTVWQAGSAGIGTPSTQLAQTTSDSSGHFAFAPGAYTCPTGDTQVYLTAQGGYANPNFPNPNIMLAAGLGNCSSAQSQHVQVNEVTTVATAYALGQYFTFDLGASSDDSFGYPASDAGYFAIANTTTIPMLVNLATGTVPANSSTITLESAKIYSLANTLAACVNDSSAFSVCSQIYSYFACSCGQVPSDTLQAITQILYYPYLNVSDLYNLSTPQAPFVGLANPPNDWTLAVSYTSPSFGLAIQPGTSSTIDIDATGNVWFPTNVSGNAGVGFFSPSTLSFTGPLATNVAVDPQYVTADSYTGFIWFNDQQGPNLGIWAPNLDTPSGGPIAPSGIIGPITVDGAGAVYYTNIDSGVTTPYQIDLTSSSPGPVAWAPFTYTPTSLSTLYVGYFVLFASTSDGASICAVEAVVPPDPSSSTPSVDDVFGTASSTCTASGGSAIAELGSDVMTAATSLNQVCSAQFGSCSSPPGLALSAPQGVATDGFGDEWIAESGNASVTELGDFSDGYSPPTPVNFVHDALNGNTMTMPYGIAIDGSGNVWVSNASCLSTLTTACTPTSFTLTEIIGAAFPTITPLSAQQGGQLAGTEPQSRIPVPFIAARARGNFLRVPTSPFFSTSPHPSANPRRRRSNSIPFINGMP